MKFLMMIKHADQAQPFQPPQSLMDAMGAFVGEGFAKGWLKDTAGLKPTREAVRIRQKGGKLTVTDGPFTEAKEIVGGYAIVETATVKKRWRSRITSWSSTASIFPTSNARAKSGLRKTCEPGCGDG